MISVLYVDEWSPFLYILSRFLEAKGDVEVETAFSPLDALQILDYISFDVIVANYNNREWSGIDLLQKTRQKGIETPFIFFTLEPKSVMEQEVIPYGRVVFLPKLQNSCSTLYELEKTVQAIVPAFHPETITPQKGVVHFNTGRV
jgi:CheY-like chemotaxis protein